MKAPALYSLCATLILASACALDWTDKDQDGVLGDAGDHDAGQEEHLVDSGNQPRNDAAIDDAGEEPAPPCSANGGCGEHSACEELSNTCVCDPGYLREDGACQIDLCSPVNGGPACVDPEVCRVVDSAAACVCKDGYTNCSGTCVDLSMDAAHCGSCDQTCGLGAGCGAGACQQIAHALEVRELVSCALLASNTGSYPVRCWGDSKGELFRDGLFDDVTAPKAIAGVPTARALVHAIERTCTIVPDSDTVRCWGRCGKDCGLTTDWGGSTSTTADFRDMEMSGVKAITTAEGLGGAGGNSCALRGTSLTCWGKANRAMITDTVDRIYGSSITIGTSTPSVKSIAGDYLHNCAVLADDQVGCWGDNNWGQCGVAKSSNTATAGVRVLLEGGGTLSNVKMVDTDYANACAVTNDGKAYCWGMNGGYLGHGDSADHTGAVQVLNISDAKQISVGGAATCIVVGSGQTYCWGYKGAVGLGPDALGDLNDGAVFSKPQRVPGLEHTLEVKCGNGHCCARVADGGVKCWGNNSKGQLGDGTKITAYSPQYVKALK